MHEIISSVHAVSGIFVAVAGLVQIIFPKVGRRHRITGKIYVAIWSIVIITGAYLGSILITLFGVFGFYMAVTGFRYAFLRKVPRSWPDRIITAMGVAAVLGILGFAVYLFLLGNNVFGTVAAVFGILFGNTAFRDLKRTFASEEYTLNWLTQHLTRMYISYIAAMTAFAVIQNVFPIPLLNWLAPTIIGTALIAFERRRRNLA